MEGTKLRVLIPAEQIDKRIKELGAQITADYPGDAPLYLIGILKGAVMFHADLARVIDRQVRIDFIGISSYGKGKTSSGQVKLTKDLDVSVEGADVLLVEYAKLLPDADRKPVLEKAGAANPRWAEPYKLMAALETHPAQNSLS